MSDTDPDPKSVVDELGLTVEALFVPFSQSRNKNEQHISLNWIVTLKRGGKDVMTTEYSAGIAHCPGYKREIVPTNFVGHRYRSRSTTTLNAWTYREATPTERLNQFRTAVATAECESGKAMVLNPWGHDDSFKIRRVPYQEDGQQRSRTIDILPNPLDVIYSLIRDADVLDAGGFESWADDLGYNSDSIQHKAIYDKCLDHALKLRQHIGEVGINKLQEAFNEY